MTPSCFICNQNTVVLNPMYETLYRVTSDCKVWKKGGKLGVCENCNAVQKVNDSDWQQDVKEIYEQYAIYEVGNGEELAIFNVNTGAAKARSQILVNSLSEQLNLKQEGRLLDIGCGNGAWFKAFNQRYPQWAQVGTEWNNKNQIAIESIKGVEAFYTCLPEEVPGDFDIITMIHVLEHIPDPANFLMGLKKKLKSDGLVIIEVPNFQENDFDLLIADHCLHFTEATLTEILVQCGFEILYSSDSCVVKELTFVVRHDHSNTKKVIDFYDQKKSVDPSAALNRLINIKEKASSAAVNKNFGIFGTGISAAWLFSELKAKNDFFVDEDPVRIGKSYMGKPVYSPNTLPKNSHVFIALPEKIAMEIQARLTISRPDIHYWAL